MLAVNERSLPSRAWRGFLFFLVVAALAVHVFGGWVLSGRIIDDVFTPSATEGPADPVGLDVTEVEYQSSLGPMDAWVTDGTRSEWVIHVHGVSADRAQALGSMAFLDDAGYHQMAIAYRNDPGQPSDPSGSYRYGVTEREDLAAAVEFAREEGATDIVLYGYGAGAAISMAYAVRQPIGTVTAMVFDSPNLDLEQTVDFRLSQDDLIGLPIPFTVTSAATFFAALRSDVNWRSFDYLERTQALSTPILVFHGSEDMEVPVEVSTELAELRSDLVRLVLVEGAGHVGSLDADPASYELTVLDFLAG